MTSITIETVERMAVLSGLRFSEEEKVRLQRQVAEIISFFDQLSEVDTRGVEPTFAVPPFPQHLREDEPIPSLPQEEALENAPAHRLGFFSVPKVIP